MKTQICLSWVASLSVNLHGTLTPGCAGSFGWIDGIFRRVNFPIPVPAYGWLRLDGSPIDPLHVPRGTSTPYRFTSTQIWCFFMGFPLA